VSASSLDADVQWSVEEVCAWLAHIGAPACVDAFRRNNVNGAMLLKLTPMHLESFGINVRTVVCRHALHHHLQSYAQRVQILEAVALLNSKLQSVSQHCPLSLVSRTAQAQTQTQSAPPASIIRSPLAKPSPLSKKTSASDVRMLSMVLLCSLMMQSLSMVRRVHILILMCRCSWPFRRHRPSTVRLLLCLAFALLSSLNQRSRVIVFALCC
jgi:hypothetical protein